jgi:hypothetical protein
MSEEIANPQTTKRELLAQALNDIFAVRNNDFLSVLAVVVGFASLGWLADSILPLFQDLAMLIYSCVYKTHFETKFVESFIKLIIPLSWFILFVFLLFRNRKQNTKELEYEKIVAARHKGLIIMLSKYTVRFNKDGYKTPKEITEAINNQDLDQDKVFSCCNWGQMAFAVAYHAPTLEKCWILTTKTGSKESYPEAEILVKFLAKNTVCEQIVIEDENDVGETANKVKAILVNSENSLQTKEIISDFTGGTSAMTSGMILATLDENRQIEYIRQDFKTDLTQARLDKVNEEQIILSPKTNLRMAQQLAKK